jgi:hypothetical protein
MATPEDTPPFSYFHIFWLYLDGKTARRQQTYERTAPIALNHETSDRYYSPPYTALEAFLGGDIRAQCEHRAGSMPRDSFRDTPQQQVT